MQTSPGTLRIAVGTTLEADVRNCKRLELYGVIEGDVVSDEVIVYDGGRLMGRLRAGNAEVMGTVEGDVVIRNLIAIRATGIVSGDVQYGRMSLEPGGELTAKVKNVPPHLVGDFAISVQRGGKVIITQEDVAAVDPDNSPDELIYTVTDIRGGRIELASQPGLPVSNFTQADLNANNVMFVHGGSLDRTARFDVVVHDAEGASSGRPRTIDVTVTGKAAAA